MTEIEFITEIHQQTNCKLLLDINNVHISSCHLNFDAFNYLDKLPTDIISEIHLSGSLNSGVDNAPNFIENHGHKVSNKVWRLFNHFLQHNNPVATLIERDINVPKLGELLQEVKMARELILRAKKLHRAS